MLSNGLVAPRCRLALIVSVLCSLLWGTAATAQTFSLRETLPLGGTPVDCVTADFNRDGRPDIACVLGGTVDNLRVLVSGPNDSLTAMPPVTVLGTPKTIDAFELGCDRRIDLIVTDGETYVQLLFNDGAGMFSDNESSTWDIGEGADRAIGVRTLVPLDFQGVADGFSLGFRPGVVGLDLDFDLGGKDDSVVSRVGEGPGTFPGTDQSLNEDDQLMTFACADFDLDAYDDVALLRRDPATNVYSVRLLLARETATSGGIVWEEGVAPIEFVDQVYAIATGNFNGDAAPDLAVATASGVVFRFGSGICGSDECFLPDTVPAIPLFPVPRLAVGDVTGDGVDDLGVMSDAGGGDTLLAFVYRNDGNGVFDQAFISVYTAGSQMMMAPFVGTRLGDVAVAHPGGVDLWEQIEPFDPDCRQDLDRNGDVDFADILEIIINWGPCNGCTQDIDGNDDVDFADILEVIINWGLCPEPLGSCCLSGGFCLLAATPDDCLQAGGDFQDTDVDCVDVSCAQFGACCLEDSTCQTRDLADCCFIGGIFQGFGAACDATLCEVGACCIGFDCTVENSDDCFQIGGEYLGGGTSCAGTCDTGACCLPTGDCVELTPGECFGEFQGLGTVCADVECPPGVELACGVSEAGDCFSSNYTPYCDDATCCEIVCAVEPFCCDTAWDFSCAEMAVSFCTCGSPISGGCFEANGTPFCDDAACCQVVCAVDPFCCDTAWDQLCVDGTAGLAECQPECGDPGLGDCFEANGTPFCDDAACCQTVCAVDPFCCDTAWDSKCAGLAGTLCTPP